MSWTEVAEIISGEIEKNGKCSAETGWTLAGHLILKLDIPGLKKKSNGKLDVTAAVKVVPELSKFVSKRGRGQGIVLKSSVDESNDSEPETKEIATTEAVSIPSVKEVIPATNTRQFALRSPAAKIQEEDSGPSGMPGSLLGNANDPGRPNLLPSFGDWIKPQMEEVKFDSMILNGKTYEIPRTNPIRGTVQPKLLLDTIVYVFGGTECEGGQVKFLDKEFLLPEENVKMFDDALMYIFGAKYVVSE